MSGDLINEELGIAQECVYYPVEGIWQSATLSPALVMMDTDRNVFFSAPPLGGKNGERTCSGLLRSACRCMPLIHFPRSRRQISANQLSVLACRDATGSEHPSSSLHSRFVFPVLDYRCQQEACTAKGPTKLRAVWHALYYASRFTRCHILFHSRMA